MNRLVAVSATAAPDSEGVRVRLSLNYARSIESAGLVPLIVPPLAHPSRATAIIAGCGGLLLTGGEDVDPAIYGASRHPATQPANVERDATEIALLRAARTAEIPVLGVCRGIQLINAAYGGSLIQDIPSQRPSGVDHDPDAPPGTRTHGVTIVPGTRLSAAVGGDAELVVNSYHHQAADAVAPGFGASAHASDGVVEGIEATDTDWWCVAVQWHPEDLTTDMREWDRGIFRAFAQAIGQQSGRR